MSLTGKQKKYIKKHLRKESVDQIASELKIPSKEIETYLEKIWGKKKYQKFLAKQKCLQDDKTPRGILVQNWKIFAFLAFLVLAVYFNSLGNDFVSDDISGILKNPQLDEARYIFANPLAFFRPLTYYLINKIFGRTPAFYRIANIFSHLGVTLTAYLLLSNLYDFKVAFFASSLFAVHPILTESIAWISGGYYSYSALFVLLSLLTYVWPSKSRNSGFYFYLFSVLLYFLALNASEKVIAFPIILIFYELYFGKLKKNWKKILPFFGLSAIWALYLFRGFGPRVTSLETEFYQTPQAINPLYQIPIAITSYLELIFWPKNLTLYHSEMTFNQLEYFFRLGGFILFMVAIIYFFKKDRRVFFWLSFFLIALLPTLTPLGVSWIVAERYVYLGALGIFVLIALAIQKIGQISKNPRVSYILLAIILTTLAARTIFRNADWKNQDTLWLAAVKTSPSSPQNHNNLGDLYARRGDLERAIEEFKIAIELKPNYGDAYHNLANTYHQLEKDDLAVENYQKALSFNPNLWQSHQNLAGIYFEGENFELAKQELEKAISINPQNSNLYVNLGIVYLKLGEKEKAKESFQQAIQIDPENERAKQLLLSL